MSYVKVIKVVRSNHSLFDRGKFTLAYKPFHWIYPAIGKIYAFQDYANASNWVRDYPGSSMWEAQAEIFDAPNCMFCANAHCDLYVFWKFYLLFAQRELYLLPSWIGAERSPDGTVLCNRLMITNKLKDF